MAREFEIVREQDVDAPAQEVFDAITTGNGGWLWPMEYEPRVGGTAAFGGVVAAWDPPHHLVSRMDGEDGWFNQVEQVLTPLDARRTHLRYVHSGVFVDDWENQYDGASLHTDFYLHTMAEYIAHFSRQPVTYSSTDAPAASNAPDGFARLRAALDTVALPGGPTEVVVDYDTEHFLGLRTESALIRFFGRNAWGAPVGVAVHDFAPGADADATTAAWDGWLEKVYA